MRSINTLQWQEETTALSMNVIGLDNTLLVKTGKFALKALLYLPYQFNRFLDSLDDAPNPYRKQARDAHTTEQDDRHRHIPSRVWQRRSALITALEEQQELEKPAAVNLLEPVCQSTPEPAAASCTSCDFNVIQVRCLPVWSSNFADIGMIEQELDFYSQPALLNKAV